MMMMICLNCNQRLVLLLNLLRRVLSIHTDPYQALKTTCTKTNKDNFRKWEWKTTNWSSTIKSLNSCTRLKTQSPWLLAKSPSRLTKCRHAWNHNLDVDSIWPLLPPPMIWFHTIILMPNKYKNHLFIAKTNEWILAPFISIHTTPPHKYFLQPYL